MSQKFDDVEKYYDEFSLVYDEKSQGPHQWTPPMEAKILLDDYLVAGKSILDVGVGTGQTIEHAVNRGCHVTAIDISQKMLDIVATKFPSIELYRANLSDDLPIKDDRRFDIISAIGVLEFVPNLESVLKKLMVHLQAQGSLCFTFEEQIENDPEQGEKISASATTSIKTENSNQMLHYRYNPNEIQKIITNLGLTLIKQKSFQAYLKSDKLIPIFYYIVLASKP